MVKTVSTKMDDEKKFLAGVEQAVRFTGFAIYPAAENETSVKRYLVEQKTKSGKEKKSLRDLSYRIINALAEDEAGFETLWKNRAKNRRKGKEDVKRERPEIITEEEYAGLEEKVKIQYDTWVRNNKKYYIQGSKNNSAHVTRLFNYAEDLNIVLEITYVDEIVSEARDESTFDNEARSLSEIEQRLNRLIGTGGKRQIVLTGAPGTGKTYTAKLIARGFIDQGNHFYSYYRETGAKTDGDQIKRAITELLSDVSYREGAYGDARSLKEHYKAFDEEYIKKVCAQISDHAEDDTETGNCYNEEMFWNEVEQLRGRLAFVQFHPSYDYTDFVEGLRPVETNGMQFKRLDGSFMSFCRFVAWQNERNKENLKKNLYFFIIDEINRADLSKVLGELMFCLEGDKRGKENRVFTQYHNVETYFPEMKQNNSQEAKLYCGLFKEGFYIPENVVVIGTMNDIDRSVESMDFALRRRFVWEEVVVKEEMLEQAFSGNSIFGILNEDEKVRTNVIKRVCEFNKSMRQYASYLTEDYYISQGHFTGIRLEDLKLDDQAGHLNIEDELMNWVWEYRIQSLMKEYLRGSPDAVNALNGLKTLWGKKVVVKKDGKTENQPADESQTKPDGADTEETGE